MIAKVRRRAASSAIVPAPAAGAGATAMVSSWRAGRSGGAARCARGRGTSPFDCTARTGSALALGGGPLRAHLRLVRALAGLVLGERLRRVDVAQRRVRRHERLGDRD